MIKKFVYTQFIKEGYHCFPEAGTDKQFATGDHYDVSHLAYKHMHYFYFKVWVEVKHSNRDIEFIQLRRWLESMYDGETLQLNNQSCEMLADNLLEALKKKYPNVDIRIDVSEDNINGAILEYQSNIDPTLEANSRYPEDYSNQYKPMAGSIEDQNRVII